MDVLRAAKLVKLRDSGLLLAGGEEDLRGRTAVDTRGEELGVVRNLIVDDIGRRVHFLRIVTAGGFLGFGARDFLVPVAAIVRFDATRVYVNGTKAARVPAPLYDPALVEAEGDPLDCTYPRHPWAPCSRPGGRHPYPTYPFCV